MLALEAGALGFSMLLFGAALWAQGRHASAVGRHLQQWARGQGWHHETKPLLHDVADGGAAWTRLDPHHWEPVHRVTGVLGAGPFTLTAWRARRAPVGRSLRQCDTVDLVVRVTTNEACPGFELAPPARFRPVRLPEHVPVRLARRWHSAGDPAVQRRLWTDPRLCALALQLPARSRLDWSGHQFTIRLDGLPLDARAWQNVLSLANTFALRGCRRLAQEPTRPRCVVAQRPLALTTRRPVAVARPKPTAPTA